MSHVITLTNLCSFVLSAFILVFCLCSIPTTAKLTEAKENTAFSTYINLERQLALEMELVTIFSILVQEEHREPSDTKLDLTEVKKYLNVTKPIQSEIGNEIDKYISHPINAFHLIKRLHMRWSVLVEKTLEQNIPYKALRFKLDHLKDSFPGDSDFELIALGLTRMQYINGINLKELINGTINGHHSLQKPNVADLFLIARMAYDREDFYTAIKWLREATKLAQYEDMELVETLHDKPINLTSTMSLLASALYEMRHYKEALKVLEELLKADPSNKRAQTNQIFFKQKSESSGEPPLDIKWEEPKEQQEKSYQNLCKKKITPPPEKLSRLYCYLHPTYKRLIFGKAEILSMKPRIILFHDMVGMNTTDEINNIGLDQMLTMADRETYKYQIQGVSISYNHKMKQQTKLRRHLEDMKNLLLPPFVHTNLEVRNFGVQGFFLPLHENPTTYGGNIGTFMVMLNDTTDGGEIVFPLSNVTVTPKKGSALFWYSTKNYPAICPVSYGSLWIVSLAFYERDAYYCRMTEKRPWDLRYMLRQKKSSKKSDEDEKPSSKVSKDEKPASKVSKDDKPASKVSKEDEKPVLKATKDEKPALQESNDEKAVLEELKNEKPVSKASKNKKTVLKASKNEKPALKKKKKTKKIKKAKKTEASKDDEKPVLKASIEDEKLASDTKL